ncbi:sulfurtransferase [Vibrio parahaemolyticus]|uniref:sulfurtransferase n=1 Tax=Vibrio parahaemolyticus TaxID=670 RepID=UPI000B79A5C0|nr:sulfurtransferase [Vibrio parahaemolyticus]OXD70295.1 sulfurtransferase [Vibrio parahaemolyticus]HAS6576839.1 sulfurtransferase [Vibrio parahaemolyticus]HAS6581628.1 sulfurtransferase [Vibrio parahaemolyticus]
MQALISAKELHALLDQQNVKLLDASISFQIPSESNKITDKWIPNTYRFDYDNDFCLPDTSLPHMMPTEAGFNVSAQKLGLNNEDLIIVYDNSGTLASPRAWWMLKAMGHESVKVLNGGLPAWIEAGLPVVDSLAKPEQLGNFAGKLNKNAFLDANAVLEYSNNCSAHIVDARSRARFFGEVPEPREGLRSGHIPNSLCLPFQELLDNGYIKPNSELKQAFSELSLYNDNSIIFSCGSGVTACILLLAAHQLGLRNLSVYDGSWTEWGADCSLPITR